jgi:hypothetical protein
MFDANLALHDEFHPLVIRALDSAKDGADYEMETEMKGLAWSYLTVWVVGEVETLDI